MSAVAAKKMVLVSVLGLLIVATYKGKSGKVPTSTRLWGTGWLAVMLGVTADFAPQVAGPFALLILAGSLTQGGDQAFINLLGRAGAGGAPTGTTGGAPQTGHQPAGTSGGGPTGSSGQNQQTGAGGAPTGTTGGAPQTGHKPPGPQGPTGSSGQNQPPPGPQGPTG